MVYAFASDRFICIYPHRQWRSHVTGTGVSLRLSCRQIYHEALSYADSDTTLYLRCYVAPTYLAFHLGQEQCARLARIGFDGATYRCMLQKVGGYLGLVQNCFDWSDTHVVKTLFPSVQCVILLPMLKRKKARELLRKIFDKPELEVVFI